MKPHPFIIIFGMPRTGTTFFQSWLDRPEYARHFGAFKLSETAAAHPMHRDSGLLELAQMLVAGNRRPIFLHCTRKKEQVAASFYAARVVVQRRMQEKTRSDMPDVRAFARKTPEQLADTFATYEANLSKQFTYLSKHHALITADLDDMAVPAVREKLFYALFKQLPQDAETLRALHTWWDRSYGKRPVRGGRLSYGIDADLPEEWLEKLGLK